MANYIGNCITPRVSSDHIAKVRVPAGGLTAGSLVFCEKLDTGIAGNLEVYEATKPLTANLGSKHLAMVVCGGFETLADGRRPAGQPDYTQYTYAEGEIADVVFVDPHLFFEIGVGDVTGGDATPANDVGKYIVPANNTFAGAVQATNANIGCSLKILAVRNFPVGGLYGGQFVTTYVCVAQ